MHGQSDKWFAGVVVMDGAARPQRCLWQYTDEQMKQVRVIEQNAAHRGYSAQFLGYKSSEVKDGNNLKTVEDIAAIIRECVPILFIRTILLISMTHMLQWR